MSRAGAVAVLPCRQTPDWLAEQAGCAKQEHSHQDDIGRYLFPATVHDAHHAKQQFGERRLDEDACQHPPRTSGEESQQR